LIRFMRERYGLSARQVFEELPEWELNVLIEAAAEDAERANAAPEQPGAPMGFRGALPPHLVHHRK